MENKTLNIFEKMLAITSELTRVAKNLEVGFGQSKYKAVGEADVLAAVRPLEEKYKVYSYPYKRTVLETGEIETKTGTKNLFLRVETIYRFVNIEKPEEFVDVTSYGDGVDSQDKSVGKAMTYSDKYALMKAYKIMTGDDPDQFKSEDLGSASLKNNNTKKMKSYKELLSDKLDELGFNKKEYCKVNGLTGNSTEEDFKRELMILNSKEGEF